MVSYVVTDLLTCEGGLARTKLGDSHVVPADDRIWPIHSRGLRRLHQTPLAVPSLLTCKRGHGQGCGIHWEVRWFAKTVVLYASESSGLRVDMHQSIPGIRQMQVIKHRARPTL